MPKLKDTLLITNAVLEIFFAGCRNNDFRECRGALDSLKNEISRAEQVATRNKRMEVVTYDFRGWARPPTKEDKLCIRAGVEAETPYNVTPNGSRYHILIPWDYAHSK